MPYKNIEKQREWAKNKYYENRALWSIKICIKCELSYKPTRINQKYCSRKCSSQSQIKYIDMPDSWHQRDRKLDKNLGYVRIYVPHHTEANNRGYVYEHRVIAEEMIGRRLYKNEIVHHKNGKRWDNRKENLEVMDKIEHAKLKKIGFQRQEDLLI